ncbi:MAG: hypothetical protein JW699_02905 [Chitinispirillaceae bacterium]|nr:hypothetical protein [Chitinispirillaceae bacterium]
MNLERSALRGERAVNEHKLKEMKQRAVGMRELLRMEIPAYLDVATINEEKLSAYGAQLAALVTEIKETMETLRKIEEQLDG